MNNFRLKNTIAARIAAKYPEYAPDLVDKLADKLIAGKPDSKAFKKKAPRHWQSDRD